MARYLPRETGHGCLLTAEVIQHYTVPNVGSPRVRHAYQIQPAHYAEAHRMRMFACFMHRERALVSGRGNALWLHEASEVSHTRRSHTHSLQTSWNCPCVSPTTITSTAGSCGLICSSYNTGVHSFSKQAIRASSRLATEMLNPPLGGWAQP